MNNTIPRYIIASLLSPTSDLVIRSWYEANFHHPCPIRTLHLTFIPPFTTTDPDSLPPLVDPHFPPFTLASPASFIHPDRTILYLPVQPLEPLTLVYYQLHQKISPQITPESQNQPNFLPHLTLDYHFTGNLASLPPPPKTITISPPQLLTETASGIWQPTLHP